MERNRLHFMSIVLTKEKMAELEEILAEFLREKKIKLDIPVDVFDLATKLGFDVRGAELNGALDGILLVNENEEKIDVFNSNKVIAYNCSRNIDLKKFIVSHELSHYIYEKHLNPNKKLVMAKREHSDSFSNNEEEQEMDYIAAAILIPQDDLKNFLREKLNISVNSTIKQSDIKDLSGLTEFVAEKYNVEYELAKRRIKEICDEQIS